MFDLNFINKYSLSVTKKTKDYLTICKSFTVKKLSILRGIAIGGINE